MSKEYEGIIIFFALLFGFIGLVALSEGMLYNFNLLPRAECGSLERVTKGFGVTSEVLCRYEDGTLIEPPLVYKNGRELR